MRIGIVTYDYDPPIGGLGVVAKTMKQTLQKLYPDDTFVVISPGDSADDRVSGFACFRWRKSGGCPLFSLGLFFSLNGIIRKHALDLIHVHAGSGGVFLLRRPSCPVVVTSHHTYIQEAELVFHRRPFKRFWKRLMSMTERRTYDIADRISCVSKDTAGCLREQYGQPAAKLTVIENGVEDLPARDTVKDRETVLFIGRLEERKGVWVVLKAMRLLMSKHPSARLRLVGADLLRGRLQQYINVHELSKVVTSVGYVYDPLMRCELSHATVLVVPSVLEGFGLIAAEAMLAGTCVIVSDAAGLRSIVDDGKTGLVFRSGDSAACAACIAKILDNPALRQSLEREARAEALHRFGYEDRAKDLHAVFEDVLGKSRK